MQRKKSYKTETFTAWGELLVQLEYASIIYINSNITEIYSIHKEKFISQIALQNFTKIKDIDALDVSLTNFLVSKDIYYKWLEVRSLAYNFLQFARSSSGTYGHRVGSLFNFINTYFNEKEIFLKSFEIFEK